MFYCTVRQFVELLGIPIDKVYKAINNNELRPIPGTQPYLIDAKAMRKYCTAHYVDLYNVLHERVQYFRDCLNTINYLGNNAMPMFSFDNKPAKEHKIGSPSRKHNSAKFENKRTKVHVDYMGSTGSR